MFSLPRNVIFSQGSIGITEYFDSFFLVQSLSTYPSRDQKNLGIQDFAQKWGQHFSGKILTKILFCLI